MKPSLAQAGDQAKAAAAVFDVYAKIIQATEKEVSACGFGLQLDKQNTLRVTSRTSLVPEGSGPASSLKSHQQGKSVNRASDRAFRGGRRRGGFRSNVQCDDQILHQPDEVHAPSLWAE